MKNDQFIEEVYIPEILDNVLGNIMHEIPMYGKEDLKSLFLAFYTQVKKKEASLSIERDNSKLYNTLKKVFDITSGAWDDPVISEELYNEMESVLEEVNSEHTSAGTLGKIIDTKEDDRRICRKFEDKECICMGIYCGYL